MRAFQDAWRAADAAAAVEAARAGGANARSQPVPPGASCRLGDLPGVHRSVAGPSRQRPVLHPEQLEQACQSVFPACEFRNWGGPRAIAVIWDAPPSTTTAIPGNAYPATDLLTLAIECA